MFYHTVHWYRSFYVIKIVLAHSQLVDLRDCQRSLVAPKPIRSDVPAIDTRLSPSTQEMCSLNNHLVVSWSRTMLKSPMSIVLTPSALSAHLMYSQYKSLVSREKWSHGNPISQEVRMRSTDILTIPSVTTSDNRILQNGCNININIKCKDKM